VPDLKLVIVRSFGALWYCDPDYYPVARADEIDSARERWPDVVADSEAFVALASAFGLLPTDPFSDEQKLDIYRSWKVLNAIALETAGNGTWRFDYLAEPAGAATDGTRTSGTISISGAISIAEQVAASAPLCPICLARGTIIETPSGGLPVEGLSLGDAVWTLDAAGRRVEGLVIALASTSAPLSHRVVHLVLADGRTVTASPGHPLADGRRLGTLGLGDVVSGSLVTVADLGPYGAGRTYDIVVSGPTGTYLVDGIAMGSTLRP
ncbi:MAG: Hint domain-containing protein, partial [Chloroflexota bacterium]